MDATFFFYTTQYSLPTSVVFWTIHDNALFFAIVSNDFCAVFLLLVW